MKITKLKPAADGTQRVAFYCAACRQTFTVRVHGPIKCPGCK